MSIRTEQEYVAVTIVDAFFGPSKFTKDNGKQNNRGEYIAIMGDVCCVVEAEDGQRDVWRGEISNRMGPAGSTIADKYQSDLTLKTLQDIGFPVNNLTELFAQFAPGKEGETAIPNLIGKTAEAKIQKSEKNGKIYYNVQNLYGKKVEQKFSFAQFQQMMQHGQPAAAPAAPAAPAMPPQYAAPRVVPGGYYQQPAVPQQPPQQPATAPTYNPYMQPPK